MGEDPHISWFVSPVHRPPTRYHFFSTGTVVTLWMNDLKFVAAKKREWGHKFIHLVKFYHKSNPASPWAAGTLFLDSSTVRFCCFKNWHPLFCHSGLHQREPQIQAELRTYGTATFSQRVYVAQHLFKVTTVTTKLGLKLGSILVYGRIQKHTVTESRCRR